MAFCSNCGKQIDDNAVVCVNCGCATNKNANPIVTEDVNAKSTGMAVLGFFFPLIGLILYLVWKDEKPGKAKSVGKGAIIGTIVAVVLSIIAIVLTNLAAASLVRGIEAYSYSFFS